MERTLGDLWSPAAHWCHFSLNDGPGPAHFPVAARLTCRAPMERHRGALSSTALPISSSRRPDTAVLEIVVTGRADDHGGPSF
jgi:hypothetical protein